MSFKNSRQFDKTLEIVDRVKEEFKGVTEIDPEQIVYTYNLIQIPTSLRPDELTGPIFSKIKDLKGEIRYPEKRSVWIFIKIPSLLSYLHLGLFYLALAGFLAWNLETIEGGALLLEMYLLGVFV